MYISSFSISGYRSLKDVTVKDMRRVCIFHGLNNTGKSNVLSALEVIFRRKLLVEETTVGELLVEETTVGEVTKHERLGSFWQGRIPDFRDNFYMNLKNDIAFSVSVTLDDAELSFLKDVLRQLDAYLVKTGYDKVLILSGEIKYVDDDSAEMVLKRAVFNNQKHVVFETAEDGKKNFFPKVAALSAEDRLRHFEELMNLLANCFALLPADRYLTAEQPDDASGHALILTPKTFKNWLFNLSLTRAGHKAFEDIKTMFASAPFSCGDIGFSKERREIEIMVAKGSTRLPISRLGSGHQQMLYIIANVVLNKGKILGIEELEINLSPTAQKDVFEKLKEYIRSATGFLSQVMITSHSPYFEGRTDVRCYGVTHDGNFTTVAPWKQATRNRFFA